MSHASIYQRQVCQELIRVFDSSSVKSEWNIRLGAQDVFQARDSYAPRVDLAVGSFNEQQGRNTQNILLADDSSPFIQRLLEDFSPSSLVANPNPRCLLAIEIEFSGSMKHIIGDITNASMLGYIGIVIGSNSGKIPSQPRIQRVRSYINKLVDVEKTYNGLFGNVLYYEAEDFLGLLKEF